MIRWGLRLLAVEAVMLQALLTVAFWRDPVGRAIAGMAWGVMIIWVAGAGSLMLRNRERIVAWLRATPGGPRVTFVVAATALALLEEAVTTSLSNAAPLFGAERGGEAMITASLNYFDVVSRHSVIVFVPMFVAWSFLAARYAFRPSQVFVLFGLTGTLAEALSSGPYLLLGVGMWTFVYGLMVHLPAHLFLDLPGRRPVRIRHLPIAVGTPIAAAIPVAVAVLSLLH